MEDNILVNTLKLDDKRIQLHCLYNKKALLDNTLPLQLVEFSFVLKEEIIGYALVCALPMLLRSIILVVNL